MQFASRRKMENRSSLCATAGCLSAREKWTPPAAKDDNSEALAQKSESLGIRTQFGIVENQCPLFFPEHVAGEWSYVLV